MTTAQIVALIAAAGVAVMYLWPFLRAPGGKDPVLLTHIKNVIAVRDTCRADKVTAACNSLMEALLEIK